MPGFMAKVDWRKGQPVNVLITGGFGCIGSYVIRDLLRVGETAVVYDIVEDVLTLDWDTSGFPADLAGASLYDLADD